jgi:cyclohexa-1,5-dienecarbonyl-CoA hydratase
VNPVRGSVRNGIATLLLDRPKVNAINLEMIRKMIGFLDRIELDRAVRALVLRGAGRCFSAGVDIEEHLPDKIPDTLRAFHELVRRLARLPFPTISAVHGYALGGGFELVLASDLALAAAGSKLGCPEITLSVFAPVAVVVLKRRVGDKRAHDLLLTGRTIAAEEALQWGLVNGVAADLDRELDALLARIRSLSRPALALCKRVIQATEDQPVSGGIRHSEEIYLREQVRIEDMVEGMEAFLQKRRPRWSHR